MKLNEQSLAIADYATSLVLMITALIVENRDANVALFSLALLIGVKGYLIWDGGVE